MRNGRFNTQIYNAIEQADNFVLILSKNALDRCDQEGDWVRTEIEHALKLNKNIVIVSTEPEIKFPGNLPDSLKELTSYQGLTLSQEYYEESINKLVRHLVLNDGFFKRLLEKIRSICNRRHSKFIWVALTVGALILLAAAICIISNRENESIGHSNNNHGIVARIYLPRYNDMERELFGSRVFTDDVLLQFKYIDTLIDKRYHILPISQYFTNPNKTHLKILADTNVHYHNLPLRISIHNTKKATQVFNEASLEILDIHPYSFPSISVHKEREQLQFVNENAWSPTDYTIRYSALMDGESFVDYKSKIEVTTPKYELKMETDSIMGIIENRPNVWNFGTKVDSKDLRRNPLMIQDQISIANHNIQVFNVDVTEHTVPGSFPLEGFNRQVVNGEVDDDLYVILKSKRAFEATIRLRLVSVSNFSVCSDTVTIAYLPPLTFKNAPF